MKVRGWRGNPPDNEDEARRRILEAARRCILRLSAARTTLSDVATELGVTRQTVYRYYPSAFELLAAVGEAGTNDFLDRIEDHIRHITDPEDAVIEAMFYALNSVPTDPTVGVLLQTGDTEMFSRGATSTTALSFSTQSMYRLPVDWDGFGFDEHDVADFAEVLLRLFLSLLQYPTTPPRTEEQMKAFLRGWVGPALRGHRPDH
ncbi:TetR/AcrR family transcriptional regulator [Nocardia takedensis]|uniref:TetR/AcrR family transcriptional regulator n=1 Tax=Nocardia takedensis TaxID=259390 RepID=UPI003F76D0D1